VEGSVEQLIADRATGSACTEAMKPRRLRQTVADLNLPQDPDF
jgi:hypothetical protein